jgi:hypothetical protein
MARTQKEQNLYNKLLITQLINYQRLGYANIRINSKNNIREQPSTVRGYIPDLSADLGNDTTLCEIVTNDLMNETEMIEKWKILSRSGFNFHMIIPKKSFNEIKEFLRSSGINVNKYWYSKNC